MSSTSGFGAAQRYARLQSLPFRLVGASAGRKPRQVAASLRDLFNHRELLDLLIRRDLKARYKDSALGFFWSLARPLMQLAIYFVVVGQFLQAARGIPDFAVYIFSGLTAIGLFTEIVVGSTGSVLANAGLVKKVYVPRELFPLASVGSAFINFLIQVGVLLVATLVAGAFPWHAQLLYVVPSVLLLVVYGTAIGMICAALNVYLRDVQYLVEVATMLLFWATPVVYSWQMVAGIVGPSILLDIYTNNPLTLAVIGFQHAFWMAGDAVAQPDHLLLRMSVALIVGLGLLFASHRVFLRLQGNFAQEI